MIWRTKTQTILQNKVQLKDSICFKRVQLVPMNLDLGPQPCQNGQATRVAYYNETILELLIGFYPQLNLLTRPNFNKIDCQGETQLKFNSSSSITKKGSGIKPKTMSRESISTTISLKNLCFVEYNIFLDTKNPNYKHQISTTIILKLHW